MISEQQDVMFHVRQLLGTHKELLAIKNETIAQLRDQIKSLQGAVLLAETARDKYKTLYENAAKK